MLFLKQDLEDFVNDSGEDGFIIVSLGSVMKGSSMPQEIRNIFTNTFSRLKQRVLWKWEDDSEDISSNKTVMAISNNVKLLPWIPQQDLLGHPKARLFITHGGLLSNQEAVYHKVPLIALPILWDQPLNAQKIHNDGYGIRIDWGNLSEEVLFAAVMDIISNPK